MGLIKAVCLEVLGSSLTQCSVEYNPGQAARANCTRASVTKLCNLVPTKG